MLPLTVEFVAFKYASYAYPLYDPSSKAASAKIPQNDTNKTIVSIKEMIFFIFDFLSSLFIVSAKGDFEIQGPISP